MNNDDVIIRPAHPGDTEAVKELVFGILEEYGLQADSGSTDKDLDNLDYYYTNNNGYFAVIEEKNKIIATVGILKIDHRICELRKMYIQPANRGKGLGKKLLEHAMSKARELGYLEMVLETASPLKEAIALYGKYGFIEYVPEHLSERCDQAFRIEL